MSRSRSKTRSVERPELEVLESIERKLDVLVSIALMQGKTQDEQIELLRDRGLDWATIGGLVGLKPDAARMRLTSRKKAEKGTGDGTKED